MNAQFRIYRDPRGYLQAVPRALPALVCPYCLAYRPASLPLLGVHIARLHDSVSEARSVVQGLRREGA